MKNIISIVSSLTLVFVLTGVSQSFADSAEVLPKGVFGVSMEGRYYFPFDKKFNNDREKEALGKDFNATLNSNIFPALTLVEIGFGMPPGSANIGRSVVSFKYQGEDAITLIQYGLTSRLTLGVKIPYYWRKNQVDSWLDTSKATVGKNVVFSTLAPLVFPGTVPLTKSDVLNLLGPGLKIGASFIPGYEFKRFGTWSDSGVGDIEVGGRYQYLKTNNWRLAFTGGVRLPTGQIDDIDNLTDIALGDGAYALLFQFNNDYTGIKNLVLNFTPRYYLTLPHSMRLRIPEDIHKPITRNEENVDRNLGDVIELEASGAYKIFNGFSFSLLYKFGYKLKDRVVAGDRGYSYESLESETRAIEHIGIVSLCYSTIPLFEKHKFPIPMTASISYRNRFAGQNVLRTQYLSLNLAAYF
jgi:hypothetical protein